MKKAKNKQLVIELHSQGYSMSEIANQVGVSKATVFRWIRAQTESENENSADQDDFNNNGTVSFVAKRSNLEDEMDEFQEDTPESGSEGINSSSQLGRSLFNMYNSEELDRLRAKEIENLKRSLEDIENQKKQEKRERKQKKRLLNRYIGLLDEFMESLDDGWQKNNLKEYYDDVEDLYSEIEEFAIEKNIDPDTLYVLDVLHELMYKIEETYKKYQNKWIPSSTIRFNVDEIMERFEDTLEIEDLLTELEVD
jgi:transposase-like protein